MVSAIEEIYGKALRVLKDVGVRVENKWMVDRLVSHGAESKEPLRGYFSRTPDGRHDQKCGSIRLGNRS